MHNTTTIAKTPNVAYGMVKEHAEEEVVKGEQIYYEIVGTRSKRESIIKANNDRKQLIDLYAIS